MAHRQSAFYGLIAVALVGSIAPPYDEDFSSGSDEDWSLPIDDTQSAVDWSVSGGAMNPKYRPIQ